MTTLEHEEAELAPPDGWVPVDRRWLGMDRQTVRPALVVLVVAVVMIFLVPAVDRAVPAGRPVVAGERLGLDGGVQLTPASGWSVLDGAAVGDPTRSGEYPATAAVASGAVELSVSTAKFSGSAADLLSQIEQSSERASEGRGPQVVGDPRSTRTESGVPGMVTEIRSASTVGLIAAYVIDGTGVELVVRGPRDVSTGPASDVAAMMASIAALEESR